MQMLELSHVKPVACASAISRFVPPREPCSPSLSIIPPFTFFFHFASWGAPQYHTQDDASTPADAAQPVRPAATAAMG